MLPALILQLALPEASGWEYAYCWQLPKQHRLSQNGFSTTLAYRLPEGKGEGIF
jgi:hypothetical protein